MRSELSKLTQSGQKLPNQKMFVCPIVSGLTAQLEEIWDNLELGAAISVVGKMRDLSNCHA